MNPPDDYYRSLIEHAVDGVFVADRSGRYIDVNESGARLLGMTRDEVLERSITDVIVEEESERLKATLLRLAAGESLLGEWRMRRKDGTTFPGEVGAKQLADGRIHGVLRDVTKRKLGEQALRQSEERFRMLTDASFEGIAITEAGRVVESNDLLASMLGYTREELIGLEVARITAPESRETVRAAINSGLSLPYQHMALRKDGTVFPVEVRGRLVEIGGRMLRMTAIRDLSETKRMEDALQSIVAATSAVGQEFFRSLVRETSAATGLRCALVAALSEADPQRMETIAVWANGAPAETAPLALDQTACGQLLQDRSLLCDGDAQQRFPRDALLQQMSARSLLGVTLLNANGAPIGVLMALHDGALEHPAFAKSILTIFAGRAGSEVERMRVDAALRTSEENLRATVDITPHVAVQWYDREGRIERWNPASAKMFGWTAEEALGKTLDQLIHTKEEAEEFLDLLRELDETGVPAGPSEFRFRRRDGSEGTCLSTAFKIPGVASGPRFVCMDIDVSLHKRTEAALRVSAERYRLLVENSSDLVCEVYGGGRLLYVSPRFESVLGYDPTELLGEDLLGLVHPEDVKNVAAQFTRSEATVLFRARHKQGHVCWLEATRRSYRTSAGDELGVLIARDVSERKRAEQQKADLEAQLRQTQKLESLGTLAGGIAHDFNNILGAIFAYSELAAIDAEKPERVRARLTELDKAARRARDLVQQILSFSRAQRQERSAVALADVLEETLRFLRSTLPSTIEIDARLSRQAPRVLAAPVQMHQVVLNLCMNAAHAMRERPGKLTVVLDPLKLDAVTSKALPELQPGNYARLTVSDTGHGMDEETLARVFEPFFTTKPVGEGTGLGLAVTHGIVRDHQGTMRVVSAPEHGATFTVYLPAHEWGAAEIEESISAPAQANGERVLFVDDEPALCTSSQLLLEHVGYHVTSHRDPLGALHEFEQHPGDFDVVVTDLTMPGITGVELGRQLLRIRPNIPIILVSGYGAGWTLEQARAVGLRDLLQKPLTPDALMRAVQRAMYTGPVAR